MRTYRQTPWWCACCGEKQWSDINDPCENCGQTAEELREIIKELKKED